MGADMNLSQLEYFVSTVENGSFSAAAKKLFVTSQAVSKAVSNLQQELDVLLIKKGTHKARPTAFGREFYRLALDVLVGVERCREAAFSYSSSTTSNFDGKHLTVAIALSPSRCSWFTSKSFDSFRQRHPGLDLKLMFNTSNTCLIAVENEIADVAVVMGPVNRPHLQCQRLFSFGVKVALSPNHPLAAREKLSLEEIAQHPIAMPHDIHHALPTITNAFEDAGLHPRFEALLPDGESAFLEAGGVMFVANRQSVEPIIPNVAIRDTLTSQRIVITMYFVERKRDADALGQQVALYLSLTGERIKMSSA